MDLIKLNNLIYKGKHGEGWSEKQIAQRFRINIEIETDLKKAGLSDKLADTLDWKELREKVRVVVEEESYNLVERLAERIAENLLGDERVKKVRLEVDKLDAWNNGTPGVEIKRGS